jgi:omega-6 fatty acid desaturase (delta-12 desaturase)
VELPDGGDRLRQPHASAIPWFDSEEHWSKWRSLAPQTASVKMLINIMPLWTNLLLHTSHHVRTGVPVYAMPRAEEALRSGYAHMPEYRLSPQLSSDLQNLQLFDYRRMCRTDFAGRPTTQPLIPQPA